MPTSPRKPSPYERAGSAEINAMVERVAPDILELLGDGVPRTKAAIVAALAGRHDKQDVVHALIRLAVTGQVEETGGKYTLAPAPDVGLRQGAAPVRARGRRPDRGPSSPSLGLALAVTGTGSPMFVRHATPDGLDGRVRRVGLGAVVVGAAVVVAALATG